MTQDILTKDKLCISDSDGISVIPISQILYIMVCDKVSTIYILGGEKVYTCKPLLYYFEMLNSFGFICSHRAYLVNVNSIKYYNKHEETLLLKNNVVIPVAKRERKKVIEAIFKINTDRLGKNKIPSTKI